MTGLEVGLRAARTASNQDRLDAVDGEAKVGWYSRKQIKRASHTYIEMALVGLPLCVPDTEKRI